MDINLGLSAVATGVDTITATYSPTPTLVDKKILFLRTAGTNTITNPTFNPNGLGLRTITKNGGDALAVGDLDGDVILMYDLANTRWELLTPKVSSGTTLTADQVNAINNANAPDGANPFATIGDVPTTPTLAQVLAVGNSVSTYILTSPDTNSSLSILNGSSQLKYALGGVDGYVYFDVTSGQFYWTNGTKTGSVIVDATKTEISHTDLINLSAPSVTKNGVEIATVNDIAPKIEMVYSNTDASLTGTTAETFMVGLLVPSLTTNSRIDFVAQLSKSGTAGATTWKLYYNTTNNLSGSPVQIGLIPNSASSLYSSVFRRIVNKNSLTANQIFRNTTSASDDWSVTAGALTNINVDLSGKYLILSATLANSADTSIVSNCQILHYKP